MVHAEIAALLRELLEKLENPSAAGGREADDAAALLAMRLRPRVDAAVAALEAALAAAWVPCAERMPEPETQVLVATGDAQFPITIGYWDGDEWWTQDYCALHPEAWMPLPALPAPPKE